MINGVSIPLMTIIFSTFIQVFNDFELAKHTGVGIDEAKANLNDGIKRNAIYFVILGAATCLFAYGQMFFWMVSGERQAKRIRQLYYTSILRQEIAFFDSVSTGDVTTRISGDTTLYQEGISEKCGLILQQLAIFIAGFVIAYTKGNERKKKIFFQII
jgi:ABC-type multidrug transport system fused ATPase/permease subunit